MCVLNTIMKKCWKYTFLFGSPGEICNMKPREIKSVGDTHPCTCQRRQPFHNIFMGLCTRCNIWRIPICILEIIDITIWYLFFDYKEKWLIYNTHTHIQMVILYWKPGFKYCYQRFLIKFCTAKSMNRYSKAKICN